MNDGEYLVCGKMKDNGGWEHSVRESIQISPNKKDYIVCSLVVDGQQYVWNAPRANPGQDDQNNQNNQVNGNYADSADITVDPSSSN